MIEAVGTVSAGLLGQRSTPQAEVAVAPKAEAPKGASGAILYVVFKNDLDRAILEARSEDGVVLRQYPSEYQIRAIQAASSLAAEKANSNPSATTTAEGSYGAATPTKDSSAPVPGAPAPQSVSIDVGGTSAPEPASASSVTQSLIV